MKHRKDDFMKKKILMMGKTIGIAMGGFAVGLLCKKGIADKSSDKVSKFRTYYNMLNQWLGLKQKGKSLGKWFEENGYKRIAIYGMGEMGNRLYEELGDTDIEVIYAIDKNSYSVYSEIQIYSQEDDLPDVDAIIVSAVFAFDEISDELKKNCSFPVISLEDVVYES